MAIVGAPNAGKSTLVNRLVGTKVSIVSPKVQTTRTRVLGIALVEEEGAQVIFIDTPGIFKPKLRLERAMVRAAWSGAADADMVALIVDAKKGLASLCIGALYKLAVPAHADAPVLLLGHEPDYAIAIVQRQHLSRVDVLLSGHSHGGQVRLPGGIPLTLPPGASTFYEGIYHIGHTELYVNRGIGTVGVPFRLNCPPEITVFTLKGRAQV